ncbi:izumo sperm-egg fusion protein 3 [Protobothrops mucrosquamatus]|uniref:izumo sperm-egg fusion protein 3 n=1 Tax=Protobothrops mucrosquamatus TaxID=103944 RepID=UPI0010FB78C8|nr:izumo sperm-egg fusion protein 3 [Protobothrops mucrosquamatus]
MTLLGPWDQRYPWPVVAAPDNPPLQTGPEECPFVDQVYGSFKTVPGVFLWQLSMYQLRFSLRKKIHQILEKFADLGTNPEDALEPACSEDCTVIEGPILDCWTCLRITTQCFDGEVCGVEDRHLAEYNEIVLYVFLVCESAITTWIILV